MIDWKTVVMSFLTSSAFVGLLIWFIKKSIQHEYDVKLEGFKAGYQKVLDENRIAFSWWHEEQAKAIKEIYIGVAELCLAIDCKLRCLERTAHCNNCDPKLKDSYMKAKEKWECNKIFLEDKFHEKIDEIFLISFDIKINADKSNDCIYQRQNAIEYCRKNKETINNILSELRKELRVIMSGGKSK